MKHLNKREDFLKRTKHSKITNIINEEAGGPFTNDIPWGDSLVGRLINSFIRKSKIGYNSTKIQPLLDAFKGELDILISSSLSRDNIINFNKLQIKALFHKIKQVCISSDVDSDKLDELIGGHTDLSGDEEWSEVLTIGLLPDCYNFINDKMDDKQLQSIKVQKDKLLTDVSNFINNLRKLTSNVSNEEPKDDSFAKLFGSLVNKFSGVNESLLVTGDILLERNNNDLLTTLNSQLKSRTEQLKNEKDPNERKKIENEIEVVKKKIQDISNKIKSTSPKDGEVMKPDGVVLHEEPKPETGVVVKGNVDKEETRLAIKGETGLAVVDTNDKIKKIKQLAIKCKPKNLASTEEILKDTDANAFIKAVSTLDEKDLDYLKRKNPKEEFESDINNFNVLDDVKKVVGQPEKIEAGKPEMVQQEKYIYESNEDDINKTSDGSVLNSWDKFLSDSKLPKELVDVTKNEIDELEKSLGGLNETKLEYDISNNPDPIISICRIFKRANDIYFTPVIPSGRSGGKVSNKTFLEYEKLGGVSSASDANSPGYGPWAVRSLRNSWVDGVTKILGDQKYRKILSNIKFIVPGSEDNFNKVTSENFITKFDKFIKLFEADETESAVGGKLGVDKKSHGQILFDFINALLDNKTAANFDEQKRILLKKYFEPYGFKAKVDKVFSTPIVKQAECEPKTIFWTPTTGFGVASTQAFNGKFYAIPIIKSSPGNHEIIFLHLLKRVAIPGIATECYYVKFLFDSQEIVSNYKDAKHSDYEVTTDWSTQSNSPANVYYGIITKINNNRFSLFYGNIADRNNPGQLYGKKNGFTISTSGSKSGPNGNFPVCLSVLVESSVANQSTQINTDYCGSIKGEFSDHSQNLNIESDDKDFSGKLLLALVEKLKSELTK